MRESGRPAAQRVAGRDSVHRGVSAPPGQLAKSRQRPSTGPKGRLRSRPHEEGGLGGEAASLSPQGWPACSMRTGQPLAAPAGLPVERRPKADRSGSGTCPSMEKMRRRSSGGASLLPAVSSWRRTCPCWSGSPARTAPRPATAPSRPWQASWPCRRRRCPGQPRSGRR